MGSEVTWRALGVVRRAFEALPPDWALFGGGVLGGLVWALDKGRVDGAEARCVGALGVGVTRARRIVRASYVNLGRSVVEFLLIPKRGERWRSRVAVHGEEYLRRALEGGRGVVLLTAHFGSWELAAATLAARGFPMNAIGAEQRDPRITDLIISLREAAGVRTIGKGFDLKGALRCLRRGEILGVLLDQDARSAGIRVPFLGHPASTPYGPVKMAAKMGSRVVPLFMVRRPDGISHDLHLLPALEGKDGLPFGQDEEYSVALCNEVLGTWIRRHPDHWMWLYPRWASTQALP